MVTLFGIDCSGLAVANVYKSARGKYEQAGLVWLIGNVSVQVSMATYIERDNQFVWPISTGSFLRDKLFSLANALGLFSNPSAGMHWDSHRIVQSWTDLE